MSEAIKNEDYLKDIWNTIKDNKPLIDRVLDRSSVASATFLQSVEYPNEIVLVGNTHLYFHPDADHIRLLQGGILIYWLKHIQNQLEKKVIN